MCAVVPFSRKPAFAERNIVRKSGNPFSLIFFLQCHALVGNFGSAFCGGKVKLKLMHKAAAVNGKWRASPVHFFFFLQKKGGFSASHPDMARIFGGGQFFDTLACRDSFPHIIMFLHGGIYR